MRLPIPPRPHSFKRSTKQRLTRSDFYQRHLSVGWPRFGAHIFLGESLLLGRIQLGHSRDRRKSDAVEPQPENRYRTYLDPPAEESRC
jgi:hypothetical protein